MDLLERYLQAVGQYLPAETRQDVLATLIIPPSLIPGLLLFDGRRTNLDLQTEERE